MTEKHGPLNINTRETQELGLHQRMVAPADDMRICRHESPILSVGSDTRLSVDVPPGGRWQDERGLASLSPHRHDAARPLYGRHGLARGGERRRPDRARGEERAVRAGGW